MKTRKKEMKKYLSFLLCLVLLAPVFLTPSRVKAYPGDPYLGTNARATEGTVMFLDYFNGKRAEYLKTVQVLYDPKGRILDDGFDYHLYDRNGHEIMISNPMYAFPLFGDFHLFNSEEARIQFNEDGSPSGYSRLYRTLRFAYDGKGNIDTVEFLSGSNVEYILTYTYSGNSIGKIHVEDRSGGAGGKTDYTFEYDGDRISKIHGDRRDNTGSYHDTTETVYTYDNQKRLKSVVYSRGETVYESVTYSYDGHGKVISAENYIYDKAEEGYVIYYTYEQDEETVPEETETEAPETEAPAREGVTVTEVSPERGSRYVNEPTGYVQIYFSETIDKLHPDQGTMRLVNDNTGEVFFWNLDSLSKTMRDGVYRIYGNRLCYKLPSKLTKGFDGFQTGCSYHLELDPEFISFKGTKEKCYDGRVWDVHLVWDVDRVRTGTFSFTSTENFDIDKNRVGTASFRYDPAYFMKSSLRYDPHLAVLSLNMAMASYNGFGRYPGSTFIKNFFRAVGFPENSIWTNADYDGKTEADTTGVAIASGKLDEETTLIAVSVRSGNYGMEWGGNFRVGTTSTGSAHLGFQIGCDHVLEALSQYISEKRLSGHVKIWISGYSRGSAIANLTAARLGDGAGLSEIHYSREDIYAYCFEVPATTTDRAAGDEKYNYIFNIVNPVDPVPRLPLYQWGFVRYGRMVYIPAPGTDPAAYSLYEGEMKKSFMEIYGQELKYVPDSTQIKGLNRLMTDVHEIVKDRDVYGNLLQAGVIPAVQQFMAGGEFQKRELVALIGLFGLAVKNGAEKIYSDPGKYYLSVEGYLKDLVKESFGPLKKDLKQYFSGEDALTTLLVAHYPELALAWMEALEYTGVMEQSLENASRSSASRYARNLVKYNCPVTIVVSDREGAAVASVSADGGVWFSEDSPVDAWSTEDGGKVFALPNESEFLISSVAEENGEMQVSVITEDILTGEAVRITNYYGLPLVKNQAYQLQMDTGFAGSDHTASLTGPDRDLVQPDLSASGPDVPLCHLSAAYDGEGYVTGQGYYAEGVYAFLQAVPGEGMAFREWRDASGTVISSEPGLVCHMRTDLHVEAVFVEDRGETASVETPPSDGDTPGSASINVMIPIIVTLISLGLGAVLLGLLLILRGRKKKQ